jgi:hypothetical protein
MLSAGYPLALHPENFGGCRLNTKEWSYFLNFGDLNLNLKHIDQILRF